MASITCGHCRQTHHSVAEVGDCWDMEQQAKAEQEAEGAWLRAAEYDPVAQWETDQDELRAAMFGLPY